MKKRAFLKIISLLPFIGPSVARAMLQPRPLAAPDYELIGFDLVKEGGEPMRGKLAVLVGKRKSGRSSLARWLRVQHGFDVVLDNDGFETQEQRLATACRFADSGRSVLLTVEGRAYTDKDIKLMRAYGGHPALLFGGTAAMVKVDLVIYLEEMFVWKNDAGRTPRTWSCRTIKDRTDRLPELWCVTEME